MNDEITRAPLVRALLTNLARTRGGDDPLGSLARTVLNGEADLRGAVAFSWHGQALDGSFMAALAERDGLSPEIRAEFERQAQDLRDAGPALTVEPDCAETDGTSGEERQQ